MYDFETMDKRYIIFGNIFLLANRLQTVMDQTAQVITAKQWFVIMMLGMFESPPTLKQLAAICDSSHQNIKQLVLKLEAKGFVRIEQDPDDRRAMRIITTEACKLWGEENEEFSAGFIQRMFSSLSAEEISTMNTAQQKIYEALGQMKELG
ncbi:MAG: MarR family transcriptional regulator [Angelakisella sp.]